MKDLAKWQVISLISRMSAMVIGLLPTIVILKIFSEREWGLVQIAVSVGASLGIYQHLGLASANTREIAAAKSNKDVSHIFIASTFIRYCVTIPLAVGLFYFSKYIAVEKYSYYELILPLRLYAVALLFQGIQSVFNSVISGTQRFKSLFSFQVITAVLNAIIYIPLVYLYKINGYFYAFLLYNIVNSFILGVLALKPLLGSFEFPSRIDFIRVLRDIFSISLGIYIVKILSSYWERIGPILLGLVNIAEDVGVYTFALLYAKKLLNFSDAITDVNLPVFSYKFSKDIAEFKHDFSANFNKLFGIIICLAAFGTFWARDLILFAKLIIGPKVYERAVPFILPILFAFVMYSFLDIIKSSVLVPAKLVKEMIISYVTLLAGITGFFLATHHIFGSLTSMAWAMLFGAFTSVLVAALFSATRLKFNFLGFKHSAVLLLGFLIGLIGISPLAFVNKIALFPMVFALYIYFIFIIGFVTRSDILNIYQKVARLISKV